VPGRPSRRQPTGPPPPPTVQKLRVRYAKRGRLRFSSHRDIARALERALRRSGVPMAYSAGFNPHPKVSYVGAAPTGVASEAEYFEIGVVAPLDPERVREALDSSLPPGLDVLEVVAATAGTGGLPDRIDASRWEVRLPGVAAAAARQAVAAFLAADQVPVERRTKDGRRTLDAREAVVSLTVGSMSSEVTDASSPGEQDPCAILRLVVRHLTPAVRPDDVLAGLRRVADLEPPVPPSATRLEQGRLDDDGLIADPLTPDRKAAPDPGSPGGDRQAADVGGPAPAP
jgi:radical SAM-linked protein